LAWHDRLDAWNGDRAELEACWSGTGLSGWETKLPTWEPGQMVATRKASGAILKAVADVVPGLIGGGADLTANTGTELADQGIQSADDPGGRQIYFGVREHAMGAVMNGMALHGGSLPFGGTFFVFSDYMRPAVRLAALMGTKVLYSWTHDSVGLGEDGPTHQPVEHLASFRAMPGLSVLRPADANECAGAWRVAINATGPVALILSRQDLPVLVGTADNEGVARGAYVLVPADTPTPDLVLVGTGSEVHLCVAAAEVLAADGIDVQVVSMPSWDLFDAQEDHYRDHVLPVDAAILAVEAGASLGWDRYADDVVAIDRFGLSAPGAVALATLGFTVEGVVDRARTLLADLREDTL
ncbi:MAG: transketolase, partial [Actinobacteria bacterium]|nr:transketolase [Actinomycetota bacterium]